MVQHGLIRELAREAAVGPVLTRTGGRRAVGVADLLTAALAAEHGMTVLHHDGDFEIAAEVRDFEDGWVLPRGTV